MCGVEYFAHPWEFGPRKTKELMLTGDSIDVDEAHRLGMVSKIFPDDELADRTLEFARRIAAAADDDRAAHQGVGQPDRRQHGLLQRPAARASRSTSSTTRTGRGSRDDKRATAGEEQGVPDWRNAPPIVTSVKDRVRADA